MCIYIGGIRIRIRLCTHDSTTVHKLPSQISSTHAMESYGIINIFIKIFI